MTTVSGREGRVTVIELPAMPPRQQQAWHVLLDLADADVAHWCLIGGQMVYVHAAEAGVTTPRPTLDVDVVVDVVAKPDGTMWLSTWLIEQGLVMDGMSPDGIGHRFVKDADPGPGKVSFDVLAPDHIGPRARLVTRPPARTVEARGTRQALSRAEIVDVTVVGAFDPAPRSGRIRRPNLLGAILTKAASASIPIRQKREQDLQDAAVLLACVRDPIALRAELDAGTKGDARSAGRLAAMLDPSHRAWRVLEPGYREAARASLSFLLED